MEFLNVRIDFVGLSTDTKPTQELRNGSTFYTVDTQELYIWYKGTWYNQNPVETTPTETTDSDNSENRKDESIPVENGDER